MADLVKTSKAYVNQDDKAILEYWEQQFATTYDVGGISDQNKEILKSLVRELIELYNQIIRNIKGKYLQIFFKMSNI